MISFVVAPRRLFSEAQSLVCDPPSSGTSKNVGVREQLYRAPLLRRVLIDANRTKSKAVILHFRKP
jgi:hypothetical protein